MKRNISDLLDEILADAIELNEKTPLSARRIKERTMSQIGERKTHTIRWLPLVAAIAAVVILMTVSVFAADVMLNDGALFSIFFGDPLSDDEVALMDDIGKTFGESVTSNGTTITLLQGVADEAVYWLHLRVEAPEGVVLPDIADDENLFYSLTDKYVFEGSHLRYKGSPNVEWVGIQLVHTIKSVTDENPMDNVKEFIITFYGEDGSNQFARPGQIQFVIPGLYIHEGRSPNLQTLFTGRFVFDISINQEDMQSQKVRVDTGTVTIYNEEYDYTTTVSEVTISPLHIDIDYSYTDPDSPYIFPYGGPVQIVMKDGTTVKALDAYFDARTQTVVDPDDVAGARYTCFDVPIVVENIDYIIIGGEHIFDVN